MYVSISNVEYSVRLMFMKLDQVMQTMTMKYTLCNVVSNVYYRLYDTSDWCRYLDIMYDIIDYDKINRSYYSWPLIDDLINDTYSRLMYCIVCNV